jgi:DUSP domain
VLSLAQCPTRTTCRYVLDLKWFNAWKAYTDQRSAATETDQKVAELTLEETEVCLPPGPISNEALKELPEPTDDRKGELRKGLDEGYDYTLLPQAAYQQLETWYGGGPTFQRSVIERGGAQGTPAALQIELYPVRFRWARCGADCLPDTATWQKQLFSRSLAVKQVRATIMHKLKLDCVNNVRISVHMAEDSEADVTTTAAATAAAPAQALPQPMDLSAPGVADTHVPEHDSSSSSNSGDAMAIVQAAPSTGSNSTVAAAVNSEPALAEPLPEAVAHNDLTASAVVVEANEVLREKEGGWLIVPRAGEDAATSSTSSSSSSSGVHVGLDEMDTDDVSTGSHDVAAAVVPSDESTENSSATAAGDTAGDTDMSTNDADDATTAVQHSPAVIPWQQAEMSTGADTATAATAVPAVPASTAAASATAAAAVAQGADYWQVVSPKSMSQTLDSLLGDFHGRVDVLVESRASESDPFPRDAIVNAWRQQLKPGDLLDAKDGEGQWFESIVKEIVYKGADGVQVS